MAAYVLMGAVALAGAGESFRPQAAVLDFQNVSDYNGRMLSRRAADQLAVDLGATGRWRIIDRGQTRRAACQRELQPPYAVGLVQELAHALGADVVFTGAIQKVEINAKAGAIRVTLLVEAIDQISGQTALAVVETGQATRQERSPEPTDLLVGKALAAACAQAAQLAARGTGQLLRVVDVGEGKTITLQPETGVVTRGTRLLLYRAEMQGEARVPGKLIATLMVSESGPGGCRAQVLARAGDIHTEDIAVSICGKEAQP